ncbi:MAG: tetratricopeptide repeat protein [Bacteroidales bacterium]|jgi:tetratricopeptide (TPR) repeat protein|nr:tetratricopeptide repeat protein [Bacteroidales bacterium]
MKTKVKIIGFCTLHFALCTFTLSAQSDTVLNKKNANALERAADLYVNNDFQKATEIYDSIAKSGVVAPELYYNLGNCYFRMGNYPLAVVNFERSLRLCPNDKDAQENLKIVNTRLKDKFEAMEDIFFVSWWKNFCAIYTRDIWAIFALVFFILTATCFTIYWISKTYTFRKTLFFSALTMFSFAIITFCASLWMLNVENRHEVVVLKNKAKVMSAPDSGKEKFQVNSGTKLRILDELNNTYRVEAPNGDNGWLNKGSVVDI